MAQPRDLFRGDTSSWSDRTFLCDHSELRVASADAGCATGRLLLNYLAYGIAIDGVAPELLAVCRKHSRLP